MTTLLSTRLFKVEPAERSASTSRARRIVINSELLRLSKVYAGDVVCVTSSQGAQNGPFVIGVAWPSVELAETIVQLSCHHLLSLKLSRGDEVYVRLVSPTATEDREIGGNLISLQDIREAQVVRLREDLQDAWCTRNEIQADDIAKRHDWLVLHLREVMIDLKYLTPHQVMEVSYEGVLQRFKFVSASMNMEDSVTDLADAFSKMTVETGGAPSHNCGWSVNWHTSVSICLAETDLSGSMASVDPSLSYDSIGGMDKQINEIRDLIEIPLTRPDLFYHFGLKPPSGILLYGPPGTGKTHLARAVASSTGSSVLIISGPSLASAYHGETESKLRGVFREARLKSPCVIVIDEVDALCPRREDSAGGEVEKRVVATLLTEMDGVVEHDGKRIIVVATTNRPNAIDPALRRPGRFDREIEIGIPDATARLSILRVLLSKSPHSITKSELELLASQTHGYVGADLGAVVRDAGTLAIKRHLASHSSDLSSTLLTMSDMLASLAGIRPSALREVFIETPHVRWSDIGGQTSVKQKLRQCVEWPLLHPATFYRLGVRPPKGVLLYGPPGCSKTLTAKALATESGVNFIAIKGPELLNKFVGESERAIRELFRKARVSSPSILFFDEIDALGASRSHSDSGSSHKGVLTTLLNEMDGIQELTDVTVVAATNRPDVLDSALMRPGRLDRILYVGPPDQQGREEILRIRTCKMAVDPELDVSEIASLTEGCSGAEIVALCQDAALLTMQRDMDAPYVTKFDFANAARSVRRQITPEMIQHFTTWKEYSGLRSA